MSVHTTKDGRHFVVWYEQKEGSPKFTQRRKVFGRGDLARQQALRFDQDKKREKGRTSVEGFTVERLCMEYHNQHPVEASTLKNDKYKFSRCLLPILGHHQVDLITSKDLDLYAIERRKQGVKNGTISREIRLLKAVFSWAEFQEPPLIHRNPIARYRIKLKGDATVPAPPSLDEIQRLINTAEPHLVRALMIFWHTGIRPGKEMYQITWEDLDFSGNEIRIHSARKGARTIRFVPIAKEAVEFRKFLFGWMEEDKRLLREREIPEEKIWETPVVHFRFKPVLSMKRAWATAKNRAKIKRELRLYDMRHAFATNILRHGGDLKSLSEIMGHSRPDTTMRSYQHVTRDQHRETVGKVPGLSVSPGQFVDNTKRTQFH